MQHTIQTDLLVIGAGPAGLAAAIQAKKIFIENDRQYSVLVIDKAPKPGEHNLSGACFEADCLDAIFPDWRERDRPFATSMRKNKIQGDDLYFLTEKHAMHVPSFAVPKGMKHTSDYLVSISELTTFLCQEAEQLGVQVYHGFAAESLIVKEKRIIGIKTGEKALDEQGNKKSNYSPHETIYAKATIVADGSLGTVSTECIERFGLQQKKQPQVYSIGVKQVLHVDDPQSAESYRPAPWVVHSIGYPNRTDVFGGGFLYYHGNGRLSVGLIIGLNWRYSDLNPQQELELYKRHPFIRQFIPYDTELLEAGVKTAPEGGYCAMPTLGISGALLAGDAAGLVNLSKLKGIHLAIQSGIASGKAGAAGILTGATDKRMVAQYTELLDRMGVMKELYHSRNFRQVFDTKAGVLLGAPLSLIQRFIPFNLSIEEDRSTQTNLSVNRPYTNCIDRNTFVYYSGTMHREDQPPHIKVLDHDICNRCEIEYGCPCLHFCPGGVYEKINGHLHIKFTNCLHDRSCIVKCPFNNINWMVPEGGQGPVYKTM